MEGLNEYKTTTGDKKPVFEEKRPNQKKMLEVELKVFKPDLKKKHSYRISYKYIVPCSFHHL